MEKLRSWAGNVAWRPKAVHRPRDEQEIAELVTQVSEDGGRLKPVGSGLSWSDINEVEGQHLLLLERMTAIDVQADARRVRVQGGAVMSDIQRVLAEHHLALDNIGSIVTQTAAGYTGTGTHGSGTPLLSTFIEEMRLVDGTGRVRELSPQSTPELFSAARVHLGCLGVVTEITFRCIDAFDLEERREIISFDRVLADLDRYLAENDYVKLWWLPYTDVIQVYLYNRTREKRTTPKPTELMEEWGLSTYSFSVLLSMSRGVPALTPAVLRLLQRLYFTPRLRVNRGDRLFNIGKMIPIHNESEYAIPRGNAAEAIDRLAGIVRGAAPEYWVNFPVEVRFVPGDDIPMSPATGRDSCYLGAYVASSKWTGPYHRDFEGLMREYAGRPHWGKLFYRTANDFAELYPLYKQFDALRKECDPKGLFRNAFVDRVFGEPEG
ncbi:MAG: D-arabinono-1,4-lactone oxidase [Desulfobacteraceae bacterium]|jgi:L-gulonolactone oxidase